jgi:hypothetical protein
MNPSTPTATTIDLYGRAFDEASRCPRGSRFDGHMGNGLHTLP